jgi:DNA replication protein DnaC
MNLPDNVISTEGLFDSLIDKMVENSIECNALEVKLNGYLKTVKKKKCEIHNTELPVDYEASLSKCWFDRRSEKLHAVFGKCPTCEKAAKARIVNESWKKAGIPTNMLHCTFGNYDTSTEGQLKALQKVKKQMAEGGFIILRGTVGTGKTHLSVSVLKHIGGLMVTEADLLGELRKTYISRTQSADDVIDKYRKVSCLVIDELDSEVIGVDIPQLLYRILARRYDDEKLTILTSNESLDTILKILGEKLKDRIKDNYTVVTFDWPSHRGRNEI